MKTHIFREFDAFTDSVRGVDCTMMLQNPKRQRWTINQLPLPEILVQVGRLGSGNIVEGQSWPDGYLLYLPLTDNCAYSANGRALDKHSFMILEPGCEFCISTKDEHDWCTIFVPSHILASHRSRVVPPAGSEKMVCRTTPGDRQLAGRFLGSVRDIVTAAAHDSQFESGPSAPFAARDLVEVASMILGERQASEAAHEGRPKVSRQHIILRCKELLEERSHKRVLVGELAAAAEVSERTLRAAFHEYFGVGPVRYLQLRQMHRVNRRLQAADPAEETVTGVLIQNGEWEFGRFASRYGRLFGERPSETLRRTGR